MRYLRDERPASAAMEGLLSSMARRRRRIAAVLLAAMSVNTAACYVDKPLATTPSAGQNVSLLVSDQGRVSLGQQLGSGVHVIEGRLAAVEGDDFLVNVSRVRPLKGPAANWTGEQVRVRRGDVAVFQERRLSRSRTLLVAGIVAAGVVVFATSRSLLGLGEDDPISGPGDPDPDR